MAASRMFARIQSSFEEPVWTVKEVRKENHTPLVDYIVLAEFDIDTGSTVRHQYPSDVPNYQADWFAENMLPEGAHNREKDYTYMILNREGKQLDEEFWINPKCNPTRDINGDTHPMLYGINVVRNKADSTVRRGAVVKALALFSRYHYTQIFKGPLDAALTKYYDNPSVDVLKELFDGLNAVDLSTVPRPNLIEQRLMHRGISISYSYTEKFNQSDMRFDYSPRTWVSERTSTIFGVELTLSIPTYLSPDDVGASNISFLLQIFKESSMKIYNAIVMKKRVLFVGYDHAAGDVCQMVLSAVNMVAPAIPNIIRRSFPYANLTDMDFLTVDGYISGVTNPMFTTMDGTWDLLCVLDLPNGKGTVQTVEEYKMDESVKNGKPYNPPPPKPAEQTSHEQSDLKFVTKILSAIENRVSEEWVKLQFFEYTQKIVLQAQDEFHLNHFHERRLSSQTRARYDANKYRMQQLKRTEEFKAMPSNPWAWCDNSEGEGNDGTAKLSTSSTYKRQGSSDESNHVDGDTLLSQLTRLQVETEMDDTDVAAIFSILSRGLSTESSFQALLLLLPESLDGLHPITSGLLHSNPSVRKHSVRLLQRMELYFSTRPAFANVNKFIKGAFDRQVEMQCLESENAMYL